MVEGVQESETSLIEDSVSCSSTESNSSAVVTAEEWYLEEPRWGPGLKACPEIRLASVELYERLALDMELTVQRLIQQDNYNTIGNFVRFYNDYLATSSTCHPVQLRLSDFYRNYTPQLIDTEKTCVDLVFLYYIVLIVSLDQAQVFILFHQKKALKILHLIEM
uniref:Uncharacterized protein n=1 Tax=Triatoma infestans TaxID=30076 RepID=A0A161MMX3_TRIIF